MQTERVRDEGRRTKCRRETKERRGEPHVRETSCFVVKLAILVTCIQAQSLPTYAISLAVSILSFVSCFFSRGVVAVFPG